ncbi:MAG: DUF167 domain-containing protein [Candidatus Shapirobacteria bacterium]|jgi:hypothetical protein
MKVTVVVHPNSKKTRIEKDLMEMLHVYVNTPPLEGKANEAVIEILADFFKIKKNEIFLLRGVKSKNKIFEVKIN